MLQTADTIVAVATPPGAGGVALLRISGPEAVAVVRRCFVAATGDGGLVDRHAHYGTWHHPDTREALDDVVVTPFRGPRSYTGEDVAELGCHGSRYLQRVLLESCLAAGARLAAPGEYTERAFLNGRLDLTQAEGVADLIAAESAASHRLARTQLRGGLTRSMGELRGGLVKFASLIELENDFGEEDVEFADRGALRVRTATIRTEIARLLRSFAAGQAIREGVSVAIAGRPNAGKSTLLNALLGDDRAIVSATAGTTRDTIEADLDIEGVRFRLVDTAGIRVSDDEIEALGVERARAAAAGAAVLAYVFDVVLTAPADLAADLADLRRAGQPVVVVANKMDLNPYARVEHYDAEALAGAAFVPVSAAHAMNLALLRERLFEAGVGEVPGEGSAVLTRARHVSALREADVALERVDAGLAAGLTGDLVALDLRQALHHIGAVTGEVSTEDLLDSIFRDFCIGK